MIQTKRITIKPLKEKHLEDLLKCRNHHSTRKWLSDPEIITEEDQQKWYEGMSKDWKREYYAIEDYDTNFLGIIRSDEWDAINSSVRIGIDIAPEYRGEGYGKEAFKAFTQYVFEELALHRVWFFVDADNRVARNLYLSLGFTEEGTQREALLRDGNWRDYVMMAMLDKEFFELYG